MKFFINLLVFCMKRDVFFKDVFNTCHQLGLFPLTYVYLPTENTARVLLVDDMDKKTVKFSKVFAIDAYNDGDVFKEVSTN